MWNQSSTKTSRKIRFLKIDAEMVTYLTKNFSNTEVCDELIEEWKNGYRRMTAQKKSKNWYKYSIKRKTSSSITQAPNSTIRL